MADNQEARLAAIEASLAELREMIGQLTLQQGIHQPAAAAHPQPVANPVAANPEVTYVVKKILCSTKQEDETQRRKIFQAKCRVGEAICRLIIDSCNCENLIAKQLMEKLQLPT